MTRQVDRLAARRARDRGDHDHRRDRPARPDQRRRARVSGGAPGGAARAAGRAARGSERLMAVVRDIEPWDELLAGRPRRRAARHAGLAAPAARRRRSRSRRSCTPRWPTRCARAGSTGCGRTRPRRCTPPGPGPTIVTTGTASGKSLCFNLPTLDTLCRDARARALYLYPTKALAQDQARALNALGVERARPAIYDGDTPREQRLAIRRRANVVLTNPDMLHLGILPNHPAWGDFFANLAVVVVDEAHVYRGVFGSHVANVLRRLRRVARRLRDRAAVPARLRDGRQPGRAGRAADRARRHHGRRPRRRARGQADDRDVEPADRRRADRGAPLGAGRGGRPARRARHRGRAHDRVHEVAQGGRADVALRAARARGPRAAASWPSGSRPTAPATRRSSGASSSAGCSTASCSASSPPTRSSSASTSARSTRRSASRSPAPSPRCGRCGAAPGRRGRGLALYVAGEDALDQFFCRHPDEFLDRPVEAAILDPVQRAAARRAPALRRARGPARGRRRRDPRRPTGGDFAERAGVGGRPARAAGRDVRAAPARGVPGRRGVAALGEPRRRRDRRHALGRAARHRRHQRARTTPSTTAPCTCTAGASYEVDGLDLEGRARARAPVRGRLVHAAQVRDRHVHRAADRAARPRSA